MSRYPTAFDGDKILLPKRWSVRCCDCGLVHDVVFRVSKRDGLSSVWVRNVRKTASSRRGKRYRGLVLPKKG